MTGTEIIVMIAIGLFLFILIAGYWPYIITVFAIWAAYDLYSDKGVAADYTLIFLGWCAAFFVLSKLFGSPFDGSSEADYAYDDDRRRKIADNHRRETATRIAQHHQREFNKRF